MLCETPGRAFSHGETASLAATVTNWCTQTLLPPESYTGNSTFLACHIATQSVLNTTGLSFTTFNSASEIIGCNFFESEMASIPGKEAEESWELFFSRKGDSSFTLDFSRRVSQRLGINVFPSDLNLCTGLWRVYTLDPGMLGRREERMDFPEFTEVVLLTRASGCGMFRSSFSFYPPNFRYPNLVSYYSRIRSMLSDADAEMTSPLSPSLKVCSRVLLALLPAGDRAWMLDHWPTAEGRLIDGQAAWFVMERTCAECAVLAGASLGVRRESGLLLCSSLAAFIPKELLPGGVLMDATWTVTPDGIFSTWNDARTLVVANLDGEEDDAYATYMRDLCTYARYSLLKVRPNDLHVGSRTLILGDVTVPVFSTTIPYMCGDHTGRADVNASSICSAYDTGAFFGITVLDVAMRFSLNHEEAHVGELLYSLTDCSFGEASTDFFYEAVAGTTFLGYGATYRFDILQVSAHIYGLTTNTMGSATSAYDTCYLGSLLVDQQSAGAVFFQQLGAFNMSIVNRFEDLVYRVDPSSASFALFSGEELLGCFDIGAQAGTVRHATSLDSSTFNFGVDVEVTGWRLGSKKVVYVGIARTEAVYKVRRLDDAKEIDRSSHLYIAHSREASSMMRAKLKLPVRIRKVPIVRDLIKGVRMNDKEYSQARAEIMSFFLREKAYGVLEKKKDMYSSAAGKNPSRILRCVNSFGKERLYLDVLTSFLRWAERFCPCARHLAAKRLEAESVPEGLTEEVGDAETAGKRKKRKKKREGSTRDLGEETFRVCRVACATLDPHVTGYQHLTDIESWYITAASDRIVGSMVGQSQWGRVTYPNIIFARNCTSK